MHPEWLTSTVTAFALCAAAPSSHSTSSFILEIMRLWLRKSAQRSCTDLLLVFWTVWRTMRYLALEVYRGPGREFQSYCGELYRVNSTFHFFPPLQSPRRHRIIAPDLALTLTSEA